MKVEKYYNAELKKKTFKRQLMKNPILDQFVPKKYTENDEESFLDTKLDFVHTPTHP